MRFAYADPPYVGQARKHYGREEVDHAAMLADLQRYDGWAASLSVPSLEFYISELSKLGLSLQRGDYRIGGWMKPFAIFKPGVNPSYSWEPVILKPLRKRGRVVATLRDWIEEEQLIAPAVKCNITLRRGLSGAKPEKVCRWIFDFLGVLPADEFTDLYPGTGAVTVAWEAWRSDFLLRESTDIHGA